VSSRSGALRRRRKPSLVTRLRIFWVFIVLIGAGLAYLVYLFVTLPAFRARSVDVRIAGSAVSEREVLAVAGVDRDANIWLIDTASIVRRIEALPYVDRAGVQRIPPSRIAITVTQREPAACVRSGGRVITIDRTLRVLQNGCAAPALLEIDPAPIPLDAPGRVASGPQIATLLAAGRTLADADLHVRSVREDRFGDLIAVNDAGVRLLFGAPGDLAAQAKLVAPVLAAAHGRPVRTVDLRAAGTPIVEFR